MASQHRPDAKAHPGPGASRPDLFANRELSWLSFNRRVLEEVKNTRHPLLERAKFASIYESNLDEFFMVRVSGLKEQIDSGVIDRTPDGMTPSEEFDAIRASVLPELAEHKRYILEELLPELGQAGIKIVSYRDVPLSQRRTLRRYFDDEVFPVCTPLGLDPGHPFPLISNLSLNLAVVLRDPEGERRFARVKVPNVLPRLVAVPGSARAGGATTFVWLEQLLRAHLRRLFPGMRIVEVHAFRVIRDADIEIQELEAADLLETIRATVSRRRFGEVIALQVEPTMPARIKTLLMENLKLDPEDVYTVAGPLGMSDLMELYRINRPDLKDEPFVARTPAQLRGANDIFAVLQQGDVLLHHPFDSFTSVVDFIEAAAKDPKVLAIKQTLYRVGRQSRIVEALREAADRGKQVAVLVELKARFDEENNIEWARALERAGVHVTYGLVGLKTHCKLALVVREDRGGLRRYVHVGTGNYNPATARLYTDMGLLTSNSEIGADASDVFNYLTGYSRQTQYRKLLVAPVNLRQGLQARIEREVEIHRLKGNGRLIFKMNSLVDPQLIESLYAASQAGVDIDLVVRGICCLRPGIKGLSERIRVSSIVGRFLEHSRVFYFNNDGSPEIYIGSADLMPRNLDHRVEVLAPVESDPLKAEVLGILQTYLSDNVQARDLVSGGEYRRRSPDGGVEIDSQRILIERAAAESEIGLQQGGTEMSPPSPYGRVDLVG